MVFFLLLCWRNFWVTIVIIFLVLKNVVFICLIIINGCNKTDWTSWKPGHVFLKPFDVWYLIWYISLTLLLKATKHIVINYDYKRVSNWFFSKRSNRNYHVSISRFRTLRNLIQKWHCKLESTFILISILYYNNGLLIIM